MDALLHELRVAARALARNPSFTVVAVLCFALGIGATSTMFDVVDTLFLRPPAGVSHAEALVRVFVSYPDRAPRAALHAPASPFGNDFLTLRDNTHALAGLAAYGAVEDVSVGEGVDAASAAAVLVSGNYFSVLNVHPALGRFFLSRQDGGRGAPPAVVVSHRFWMRQLRGDPTLIGSTLDINGYPFTMVGVTPEDFHGVGSAVTDIWIPGSQREHVRLQYPAARSSGWGEMIGRLAPGTTRDRAQQELSVILRHTAESASRGAQAPRVLVASIVAARGPYPSRQAVIAEWLALAAVLVLAIACANVANLLLARAATRRAEIAIRLALGASRWRVARLLLAESLLLAGLGAAAGIVLALWGAGLVPTIGLPPLTFFARGRVLVFAGVAAVVCGVLFGLVPALWATRAQLATAVKGGTGEVDPRFGLRAALIVAQVALATVLLTGAGLFVHSLRNVQIIEPGFDVVRLTRVSGDLSIAGYGDTAISAIYEEAVQRLRGIPGVENATLSSLVPLSGMMEARSYKVPDHLDPESGRGVGSAYYAFVGADYFATIGTPLLRGRDIAERDRAGSQPVAIVNEALARREWPDGSPMGRCLRITKETCFTIVGVAANAEYARLGEEQLLAFFIPVRQMRLAFPAKIRPRFLAAELSHLTLLVRSARDGSSVIPAVRHVFQQIAPSLPYMRAESLSEMLHAQTQPLRLGATMLSLFGGMALALAAIGLYGVVSYTVQGRTHEMGVRVALGAAPGHVMAVVLRQAAVLVLTGLAFGLAGGLVTAHLVAHLLFGVSAVDPLTFAGACTLLACAGLLAAYVPARRATQVDPVDALRTE